MPERRAAERPADTAQQRARTMRAARDRLALVFTPSRPLSGAGVQLREDDSAFIGRRAERDRIARALIEDRVHVLIHGERGLGKTSLANLAVARAQTEGYQVLRHVCSAESDFDSILRALFQDLPRAFVAPAQPGAPPRREPVSLPDFRLTPAEVVARLAGFRRLRLVFVVDEFDRVQEDATRTAMADLIKQCSDGRLPLSLVLVGVSDDAEKLIGRHPSIQRCLARIALPLLADEEAAQIAARGEQAGLEVPAAVRATIARLARGVPYMAQLLSLRAGQAALDAGRTEIRGGDLVAAVDAAAVEADPRVQLLYGAATEGERDTAALAVLRAAASSPRDGFGNIHAIREGNGVLVGGMRADAATWKRLIGRGALRPQPGADPGLHAFGHAMLAAFVLHRAILSRHRPANDDRAR
ncbi:ATP-binding protein [Falsiroseomonas sp. HW251]|uniref:ATP-binding protein n=1 Tax=Falsiroseomonas sp. HW251 TaxID=3390998 RepID=UPI003D312B1B